MKKLETNRRNARIAAVSTIAFLGLLILAISTSDAWRIFVSGLFAAYMGQVAVRQYVALAKDNRIRAGNRNGTVS
ncbi:MAG: hypothetical protein ACKOXM_05240 [Agromyces sp.]